MREVLHRLHGLWEWYRALRSLQRIMATMAVLVLQVSASDCAEANRAVGGRMTWGSLDLPTGTTRAPTLDTWTYAR